MNAEIGLMLLVAALLLACLQSCFLIPLRPLRAGLLRCLPSASLLQLLCITLSMLVLIQLRLDSDFSVAAVAAHSNRSLPLLYKIAGSWGNHEGSMLLWVWVLAAFGCALALRRSGTGALLKWRAVALQAAIGMGFLLFILLTSNPFARQFPPPMDGEALNPALQDIALAMHPPLLYLGYVGFSIVYALAVSALWRGRMGSDWARAAHPWILSAWSALTLGIGLGSWWAYRELGWGGFWFWDPVENASLLPWLAGTALLHANATLRKTGTLASWVALLSIVTFGMSLLGTFLVRSGVLTSVHSFASDPARGMFILIYSSVIIGTGLLLFALRGGNLAGKTQLLPGSREGMIVINNLLILTAGAAVLLGTLYPMLAESLAHERISVGPPFFNITFMPLMALALFFAGLAPLMVWGHSSFKLGLKRARPALLALLAVGMLTLALASRHAALAAGGMALAAWLAAGSLTVLKRGRKRALAVAIAHIGAACLLCGVTGAALWKDETQSTLKKGETLALQDYALTLTDTSPLSTPNYTGTALDLSVSRKGKPIAALSPEYRLYTIRRSASSEAAIDWSPWRDVYAVAGETDASGATALRVYLKPMISFIWLGFMLMALGGIIAIKPFKVIKRAHTSLR